jgi:hypothetical protein
MAEPPPAWAVPGDEPDDPDPRRDAPPSQSTPGTSAPTASPSGSGPPGWGTPPGASGPPGWGAPPARPTPSPGPRPGQGGAQPNQWGPQPNQWGARPDQWGPPTAGNWSNRGPGIVPLRPLAIGEIFDGAIRAIRSNPRTMVGFSAIVIALLTLLATLPQAFVLSSLVNSPLLDPEGSSNVEVSDVAELLRAGGLSVVVNALQFVLATTIVSGLLIVAVDNAVRGQSLNPAQLWTRCRPRLFGVLGLACLVVLTLPLIMLVTMLPGLIVVFLPSGTVAGAILLLIGALAGFAGFMAVYFGFWAVAAPALLLENLGVFAALRRSFRLVRGSFWRVFGIGLLTAVITYFIRQVFVIPFSLIGGLVSVTQDSDGFGASLVQLLIGDIGTVLAGAVLYPFTAGVTALLYLDLRMRREGLDVDLMRS